MNPPVARNGGGVFGLVRSIAFILAVGVATLATAVPLAPRTPATLVVGADPDYPPFHFLDETGRAKGFDVELIRAVLEPAGYRLHFAFGEWGSRLERLERGEVDVVPMFVSARRARRFRFSKPFLLRHHIVFGRGGSPTVESLRQLAGHRVAVQHAGLAAEVLRSLPDAAMDLVEVQVEAEAIAAVARGDAEYALVPTGIGHDAVARPGLGQVVALSPPLLERSYAFAVRRDRPELVAVINAGLDRLRASGGQNRLYEAALNGRPGDGTRVAEAAQWIAWLALPLVLIVAGVAWWRRQAGAWAPWRQDGGRRALRAWLRRRIRQRPDAGFALARVNLLGLDLIEDIAGEDATRRILAGIESRLRDRSDVERVATLGPASLAVVIGGVGDRAAAEDAMRRLAAALAERINVAGLPVELRSRIGVALYPADGNDTAALIRAARMACEAALKRGKSKVCYHAALEPDPRQLTLLAELREAIATRQLGYALQPKLDLRSRRWTGAELLVRWQHPRHGPLAPAAFVPLAEREGATGDMTLYLVGCALEHCRTWREHGRPLTLAVNVSSNDLSDPSLVATIIDATGDLGPQLILEVTETDVMRDPDQVSDALARLRQCGIRISVDDFGTGHSSLTNLRLLAADELKIDRSFVTALLKSPSDQAIVRATIRLGHDLGASVTAEGIENDATLAWLARAGCNSAQGFGLARPMSPDDFALLLARDAGQGRARRLH